jgi:hypothetical protein
MLKEVSDLQRPPKPVYKVDMLWAAWTKQIETRVVRDALGIQRLARVSGADFYIGCDEIAHRILTAMGIKVTTDLLEPVSVILYLTEDGMPVDMNERMPECDDIQTVIVQSPRTEEQVDQQVDQDPYAGVKLFVDWKRIPETLPLEKAPPKGPADPSFMPWL